uniref:cysteine dioxygenase n=1 Tax=Oryza sativa subsp. japonica TaxID=39947 RepID=Q8LHI3_ORYSJ|nr:HGWP repeat containing protein-like [Oryza sativa Japonica Group]
MDQSEHHHRLASVAADWCPRLNGWLVTPPFMGIHVFTDRPPRPPPTGVSACTAGLLCHRCWASTSSPTGRLVRRRLVFPPARLAYYAAVVGRICLHRPAVSSAADWCFHLLAGLLCRRCWASTSSPTGCLVRRRLVFPPARLAYYAAVVGRLRLHRPAASSVADWCFHLHGWPIMPPLLGIYIFIAGRLVCC